MSRNPEKLQKQRSYNLNEIRDYFLGFDQEQLDQVRGREIVLVIGRTGSGKSTLVNHQLGHPLVREMHNGYSVYVTENPAAAIGHAYRSETLLPGIYQPEGQEYCLIDCPGFDDNRTGTGILCQTFITQRVVQSALRIRKIIVAISWDDLRPAQKASLILPLINTLHALFSGTVQLERLKEAGAISFAFTHLPHELSIGALRKALQHNVATLNDLYDADLRQDESSVNHIALQLIQFMQSCIAGELFTLVRYENPNTRERLNDLIQRSKGIGVESSIDFNLSSASAQGFIEWLCSKVKSANELFSNLRRSQSDIDTRQDTYGSLIQQLRNINHRKRELSDEQQTEQERIEDSKATLRTEIEEDRLHLERNNGRVAELESENARCQDRINELNTSEPKQVWRRVFRERNSGAGHVYNAVADATGYVGDLQVNVYGVAIRPFAILRDAIDVADRNFRFFTLQDSFDYDACYENGERVPFISDEEGVRLTKDEFGQFRGPDLYNPHEGKYQTEYESGNGKDADASVTIFCEQRNHPADKSEINRLRNEIQRNNQAIRLLEAANKQLENDIRKKQNIIDLPEHNVAGFVKQLKKLTHSRREVEEQLKEGAQELKRIIARFQRESENFMEQAEVFYLIYRLLQVIGDQLKGGVFETFQKECSLAEGSLLAFFLKSPSKVFNQTQLLPRRFVFNDQNGAYAGEAVSIYLRGEFNQWLDDVPDEARCLWCFDQVEDPTFWELTALVGVGTHQFVYEVVDRDGERRYYKSPDRSERAFWRDNATVTVEGGLPIATSIFDHYENEYHNYVPSKDATHFYRLELYRPNYVVGNCLFAAVIEFIGQADVDTEELRRALVDYMEANIADYEAAALGLQLRFTDPVTGETKNIDVTNPKEYFALMRRPGTWTEEHELRGLANLLQRPIGVITPRNQLDRVYGNDYDADPIFVYWEHGNHFVPLAVVEGIDARAVLREIHGQEQQRPQKQAEVNDDADLSSSAQPDAMPDQDSEIAKHIGEARTFLAMAQETTSVKEQRTLLRQAKSKLRFITQYYSSELSESYRVECECLLSEVNELFQSTGAATVAPAAPSGRPSSSSLFAAAATDDAQEEIQLNYAMEQSHLNTSDDGSPDPNSLSS